MRLVTHDEAMAVLDYAALVDFMEEEHRQPPTLVGESWLASDEGDGLLARTGFAPGRGLGVKLATVFPRNTDRPTIHSVYVLFDPETGHEQAVIAGNALTWFKTACDSALASRHLARTDSRTLLMVGAGSMAPHLIRAHLATVPSLERVLIWNRTRSRARDLAPGLGAEIADDLESAVRDADVISVATMTTEPIVHGSWVRRGTHVDLVGAFTPAMREVDDDLISKARVFVDARETAGPIGELAIPLASGVLTEADILADHHELVAGDVGRNSDDEITLFKNGGGGHLDLMTARFILNQLPA